MPITSGHLIVGITPVQIDGSYVSNYRLHVHNADNQENLYLGGPDVSITNGLVLPKLDSNEFLMSPGDSLWVVSNTTDHLVTWLKQD